MRSDLDWIRDFADATEPGQEEIRRVAARLHPPGLPPANHPTPALRAALALSLGAGLLALLAAQLRPPVRLLTERLESGATWDHRTPLTDLTLEFQGLGTLTGTSRAPTVVWDLGTVRVDVAPGSVDHLAVVTPDARVKVLGTAFSVTHAPEGTRVEVERGRVEVACTAGPIQTLGPGGSAACPPTTAAGWLARVRRLQDDRAVSDTILAAAAAGQSLGSPGDPYHDELTAIRVDVLVGEGRAAEALEVAETYLHHPEAPRARDLRYLAARLAWDLGGCDRASPHLQVLAGDDRHARDLLATCSPSGATP